VLKSQRSPKKAKRRPIGYRLGEEARGRLNLWIEKTGMTRKELAAKAQCSVNTIKSILNNSHTDHGFKKITLERLCQAVGTSLHEIERSIRTLKATTFYDFSKLASIFAEIDSSIMPVIRDTNADPGILSSAYRDLFEMRASHRGFNLKDLCSRINSVGFWSNCFFNFPEPTLNIRVSNNLDSMSYVVGSETLTVRNPKLMRNCLCADIDNPDPECAIHSRPLGTHILTRFDSGITRLEFMGSTTFFRLEKSLWPPSIDSLIMATRLNEAGVFQRNFPRVLDLGSGTGFLGLIAMRLNHSVKLVHLSDWMLSPLFWGSFNWFQNRRDREHVEVKTILARFGEGLDQDVLPYDLCLCNPPYLPAHKGSSELNMRSAVYGTDLLRYVISNHRQIAHNVYIQFSEIAFDDAEKECAKFDSELVPVGNPTTLPFRPSYRKLDEDYLRSLKQKGLIVHPSKKYPYWHRIRLYRMKSQ
jgi:methylase of polypeptide subunit release factors/transcriptional regulator with XRE-family HTH domain